MRPDLHQEITQRLIADYEFKAGNDFLRKGLCPNCGKKELYTHAEHPWVIRCGRLNKCGWDAHVKDLYPDAFENFNKRYQPTKENPTATADAYMQVARGFDPAQIRGWYEQGQFWHADGDKGTATVRFYLDTARKVYFDRFVEEVTISKDGERTLRKAHFQGPHKGLWWAPPGQAIEENDTVYLVEGCLDAIALAVNGCKAAAVLSCVNYPDARFTEHKGKNVTWVWALDHDDAGRRWTRKHVARMRKEGLECAAAQIPPDVKGKRDWNDLHQRERLKADDLEEYRHHGALLIARSATEKALLLYRYSERKEFPFEYRNRLFYFNLNVEKFQKAIEQINEGDHGFTEAQIQEHALREAGAIAEIANCYPRALYYQANAITDEAWYYFRISFPHGAPAAKNTFTGCQLAAATEFKKRLLSVAAGSLFTGTSGQLDRLLRQQVHGIRTVQTLDFVGYSKEYQAYVFNGVAVKDGNLIEINEEDYFASGKLSIKSLNQSVHLHLNPDREAYTSEWVEQLYRCFGAKGLVALAFWFGSLFAEQIREKHKSFPFLEIMGEPGGGKSTLIEFLWKLTGRRDYEGFDPSKSTLAARARNFAQVSNLPVVLIEADRDEDTAKSRRFDWDELKTAYNGRSVRARGHKNSGNETYEPPFRATIVISQNAAVNASEAILQRIVHVEITRAEHTPETKHIAEILERTPLEPLSGVTLAARPREARVLETYYEIYPEYEAALIHRPDIKSMRIAKNHAQLIALLHALAGVVNLPAGALQATEDHIFDVMAPARQQAINADHPMVQDFWELFDYLNGEDDDNQKLNHSKNGAFAVNLNHFVSVAETARQQVPPLQELKRHLKASKGRKYLGQKSVSSSIWGRGEYSNAGRTVKCWIFQREA